MIDHQRQQIPPARPRPAVGEQRQRQAVGPAGDRRGKARRGFERAERGEQGGKRRRVQRPRLRTPGLRPEAQWQPALRRAWAIGSLRSGRGVGNSVRSLSSVSHAARFSLIAVSALARPSRLSGAWLPRRLRL